MSSQSILLYRVLRISLQRIDRCLALQYCHYMPLELTNNTCICVHNQFPFFAPLTSSLVGKQTGIVRNWSDKTHNNKPDRMKKPGNC